MDAQTLAACMANVLLYARDWVTFTTLWEPELADMLALAQWQATYDTRFCYVPWDTNITATQMGVTVSARAGRPRHPRRVPSVQHSEPCRLRHGLCRKPELQHDERPRHRSLQAV